MKLIIDKDHLLKSVIIADSVVSSKNSNSVLGNCIFIINKNTLEVAGTDNEISIKHKTDVLSEDIFSFTLNGKKLIQILKEFPKGEVIIDVDDNYNVSLKSKSKEVKGNYKMMGTSKNEFPDIPSIDIEKCYKIDQKDLKDLLRKVSYAAAVDTIKPSFHGVYVISEKEKSLTMVSSDSRRLSLCTRNIEDDTNIKSGVIIPLKTVNEIFKIVNAGICHFTIKGNQCFFKIGETEIISRLVDGQFPNFRQVIPSDFSVKAYVKTEKLIESLRRVIVFTKEPSYKVLLTFSKNKLDIESKTSELGEANEEIEIDAAIDDKVTIGVNSQYLMDALKEVDFESIIIGITGPMSPLCIRPENDENSTAVIMPIQIKNQE